MVFDHGRGLRESARDVHQSSDAERLRSKQTNEKSDRESLIEKDPFRSGTPPNKVPRRIGYIRVSTPSQLTDRQVMQLEAECDELRIEYVSAVAAERPVFDALMLELNPQDTFVVVDLDRAFRSAIDAILTGQMLREHGVHFRVLSFPIDTASEEGELFYNILASFAHFERRIISRRTKEGLEAARRRGVRIGRPAHLSPETIVDAYDWMRKDDLPCRYVAALLGVSRLTLQRGFHRQGLRYPLSP